MDDDGRSSGEGEENDAELDAFREASTKGEAALKAHYEAHVPTEAFWKTHGPALRQAAMQFDADAKAAGKAKKAP
jgi:hypothetical protein